MADYDVLPVVLREFRQRFALVNLTLREATTDAQIRDLLAGRIDVGFILPPIDETPLQAVCLVREPLVAALPDRHPLAQRSGRLALAKLKDEPFILFPRQMAPGLYDDVVSFCRASAFSPRVEQEAIQMRTIVSLVSAELGVALIPASLTNLCRTGVTYKALKEGSPLTEIHLAWRRGGELPAVRVFVDMALHGAGSATPLRAKRSTG